MGTLKGWWFRPITNKAFGIFLLIISKTISSKENISLTYCKSETPAMETFIGWWWWCYNLLFGHLQRCDCAIVKRCSLALYIYAVRIGFKDVYWNIFYNALNQNIKKSTSFIFSRDGQFYDTFSDTAVLTTSRRDVVMWSSPKDTV
jgi:hypothetical protein